jgi:hypothetical protein
MRRWIDNGFRPRGNAIAQPYRGMVVWDDARLDCRSSVKTSARSGALAASVVLI